MFLSACKAITEGLDEPGVVQVVVDLDDKSTAKTLLVVMEAKHGDKYEGTEKHGKVYFRKAVVA